MLIMKKLVAGNLHLPTTSFYFCKYKSKTKLITKKTTKLGGFFNQQFNFVLIFSQKYLIVYLLHFL
jgi:hypothetical protein